MIRFRWIPVVALLTAPVVFAQSRSQLVDFELMTWPEVKQALSEGRTTALIMNGGTEQRGPQGVNGAHSLIAHQLGVEIARRLGNAIVAPVIPYSPNRADAALPGTIGISNETFARLNEEVARQMITNGFRNIVFLGDHGEGQAELAQVAKKLSENYADKGIRIVHCDEFYAKAGTDFDRWLADNGYPAGTHASVKDTSELLYLGGDKDWVRKDLIASAVGDPNEKRVNNGIDGDARRSTPEIGKQVADMKVDYAVAEIRRLLK